MYQLVSRNDFHDAFIKMGRKADFSYEGREALYNYLEENANSNDESGQGLGVELDVIGLCCEYTESTIEDARKDYSLSIEDYETDADVIEYLNNNVIVVCENPLIYGNF